MALDFKIIPTSLLPVYRESAPANLEVLFEALQDAELSSDTFSFYTSVASVFSSKIEGEEIELDSYIKHKKFGVQFQPDYTKKIDDLYNAYTFAKTNKLNKANISKAHKLLAQNILAQEMQGKLRQQNMYVTTSDGRTEYIAVSPYDLAAEMEKFYSDLELLLRADLDMDEVFYFASMIHLVFVKIHPWSDGNGRTARLLEKWFLSQKLGEKAWFVSSERYYYQHHQTYYRNIRALGLEYPQLDYAQAMPFLRMLRDAVLQEGAA
jgi:Fic family protein